MVVDNVRMLDSLRGRKETSAPFRRVLMVKPDHFRVDYAINPYMRDSLGNLNQVDPALALTQWHSLKATYERLGFSIEALEGHPELPDMVFTANQSFPFWNADTNRPAVLLSRMRSEKRKPEVEHFKTWYEEHGYEVHEIEGESCFEGNGDALLHPGKRWIWGGHGPRTDSGVYFEISRRFHYDVLRLSLRREEFYHLDTCFSILDETTVAIQPRAFDQEGMTLIHAVFDNVIELDIDECLRGFAGNCHSPDGRNVLLHRGSPKFFAELVRRGYRPHEIDTSEFMKSGGSVFCLKMMAY